MAKSIKLYRAHSLVTDPEYGKVCYHWYISHRLYDVGLPYEELIEDYSNIACDEICYIEDLVNECFNINELLPFGAFLLWECGVDLVLEEVALPLSKKDQNVMPYGGVPAGGGPNHCPIHKHPEYNLPFEVVGYYDTRTVNVDNQTSLTGLTLVNFLTQLSR